MKKSLFMLLMLAVAGMAASCENDVINRTNQNEVNNSKNAVKDADATEVAANINNWEYISIADEIDQFHSQTDYVFYFYENGDGYLTIDAYDKADLVRSMTRNSLTYWVKNEKLYVNYGDDDPVEWEYRFQDNTLTMRSTLDGDTFVFTKTKDDDMRFLGDWSTTTKYGEYYYDEHIKFVTPMDFFTYSSKYSNPALPPIEGPSHPVWYKYTFDDNAVYITNVENSNATPSKKYYRFEGGKLYLSDENGNETCYSTIKK